MKVTKKLIIELIKAQTDLQSLKDSNEGLTVDLPNLASPAPVKQIITLERHLRQKGLSLPKSYRAFLRISNGIAYFIPGPYEYLSLLGTEEILLPPHKSQWRMFPSLSQFNIARGNSRAFIAFDSDTQRKGEMDVVWVNSEGEQFRYPGFECFLSQYFVSLKGQMKYLKARRDYNGIKLTRKI